MGRKDFVAEYLGVMARRETTCPACKTGELLSVTMTVNDRDVSFTTCHWCEAKWWYQNGELVPLASVLDLVASE